MNQLPKIYSLYFCILFTLLLSFSSLNACTGIKLTAKDGSIVHGRTLEFGVFIDTSIAFIPRGYQFVSKTEQGPGLTYRAKYAAIGAMTFDNPVLMDGINEKGLAAGTFYFPGYAEYSTPSTENQTRALSPADFCNWILTQFASIEEVKRNIGNVLIAPVVIKEWGTVPPPFHYIVYDKSGKALVIEPISGKLMTYENPLGILTNAPTFDWHMTNLRNYINLTPFNVKPLKIGELTLAPFGAGSGMVGMPGDFTPPSRFVRAAIFSITANPSENAKESVGQAFHILNQFDIPVGVAREKKEGLILTDYTMLTCVRDLQSLRYYFKSYDDQTIKMVDLNKFDFTSKQMRTKKIKGIQPFIDISSELK